MSDENQTQDQAQQQAPQGEMPEQSPVTIHAQYVRDLSFENPNAPDSLRIKAGPPKMDINIGMDARELEKATQESDSGEKFYEVVLNVRALATHESETVFVGEMEYGVTVSLDKSFPEESHHPFLLIEMPRMVFPYVRQIMSTLTVDGGFPPLMLNPVDFQALYMDQFGDQIRAAQEQAAKEAEGASQQ